MKSENVNLCNTPSRGLRTSSAKRKYCLTTPLPGYAVLPPHGGQCKRHCALSPSRARETTRGFTLIELLVVVLIIGILAAVAVPWYQKAILKSRFVQLMTIGDAISQAEEVYYLANGEYSATLDALDISLETNTANYVVVLGIRTDGHSLVEVSDAMYPALRYWHYLNNHSSNGIIKEKAGKRICHVSGKKGKVDLEETTCQNIAGTKTPIYSYSIYRDYLL